MAHPKFMFNSLIWLVAATAFFGFTQTALARVAVSQGQKIQSKGSPVDTCMSLDGTLFFVLTRQGAVEIYDANARLKETISLDFSADTVTAAKTGDTLFLGDSKTGTIHELNVEFIQNIHIKGSPFKGPENAPVTLVIFTDFQCVYCGKATDLLNQVEQVYPDKVKIVFKNFPLSMHKFAMSAAIGGVAAHKQGQFWPMHDLLFENAADLNEDNLLKYAESLGLDMDKFTADILAPETGRQVKSDMMAGRSAGVRGTPSIFINGRHIKRRTLNEIKRVIDEELKKTP